MYRRRHHVRAFTRVLGIDQPARRFALRFDSIKVELLLPHGLAGDRGLGAGRRLQRSTSAIRLIVWRVDFAFEGVKDAEHYAATKAGSIKARRPGVKAQARKLGDGTLPDRLRERAEGTGRQRARARCSTWSSHNPSNPKEGVLVTLGVPASEAGRGLQLLALIKPEHED